MTDISKDVMAPPRSFLSQDAIQVFYRLLAALLICAVLAVLSDSFLSLGNILNVLRQASLTFFIASGLTLVVLTAGLDLSVGANVALSACIAGTVIHKTGSPALGILTGLACGGLVGLLNGVMVTALRIPSFIATYGMLWVLNGLTYWYMAGETLHGFPAGFRQIGSGYLFGLPIPVYLLLVFLGIGTLFAQRTIWGQEIYAIGANPVAARLSGIPVDLIKISAYAFSGFMVAVTAIFLVGWLGAVTNSIGTGYELQVIASTVIGGASLTGGFGSALGAGIGAILVETIRNALLLAGVNPFWQGTFVGCFILAAVLLERIRSVRR